jgi:hypothetical protein
MMRAETFQARKVRPRATHSSFVRSGLGGIGYILFRATASDSRAMDEELVEGVN